MNGRLLKIALAVSVALNLFAGAAGVTALLNRSSAEARIEQVCPQRSRAPMMTAVDELDEQTRGQVKASLRAAALSARPDFQDARQARREAIELARQETFDAAAVSALLERSRASEMRGRALLEVETVRILSGLGPQDRDALSPVLMRHSPRLHVRERREGEERAPAE